MRIAPAVDWLRLRGRQSRSQADGCIAVTAPAPLPHRWARRCAAARREMQTMSGQLQQESAAYRQGYLVSCDPGFSCPSRSFACPRPRSATPEAQFSRPSRRRTGQLWMRRQATQGEQRLRYGRTPIRGVHRDTRNRRCNHIVATLREPRAGLGLERMVSGAGRTAAKTACACF